MKVVASAPGKLVVSGEYAVLAGAPALALCINRRVTCTLGDGTRAGWHFVARGFAGESLHSRQQLVDGAALVNDDPGYLCQHVVKQLQGAIPPDTLPENLDIEIDSRAGFNAGQKLGIGTSAAVCVSVTAALLRWCNSDLPAFPIAQRAHQQSQGGRGSGVDVAAACSGGFIRYERGSDQRSPQTKRLAFPARVAFATIWTGVGAATRDYLQRFDTWCAGTQPAPLRALIDAANDVADAVPDAARFVRQLRAYAEALQHLDRAAQLGIYSNSHQRLAAIGTTSGVVYKPCGAGGGDFGMAFAQGAQAIESFAHAARAAGFVPLPLELDLHGITVGIEG
jgi:phosphomevalonate kinase